MWYVRDKHEATHGPFDSSQMRIWLAANYLNDGSLVATDKDGPFHPLSTYFPNGAGAFTSSSQHNMDNSSDADGWFFKDKHGTVQGPFKRKQMRQWALNGYFSSSQCVLDPARVDDGYMPVYLLYPNVNDAFLSAEELESGGDGGEPWPEVPTARTTSMGGGSLVSPKNLTARLSSSASFHISGHHHLSSSPEDHSASSNPSSLSSKAIKSTSNIKQKIFARAAKVTKHARSNSHASILAHTKNPFSMKRNRNGGQPNEGGATAGATTMGGMRSPTNGTASAASSRACVSLNNSGRVTFPVSSPTNQQLASMVDTTSEKLHHLASDQVSDSGSLVELSEEDSDFDDNDSSGDSDDETWYSSHTRNHAASETYLHDDAADVSDDIPEMKLPLHLRKSSTASDLGSSLLDIPDSEEAFDHRIHALGNTLRCQLQDAEATALQIEQLKEEWRHRQATSEQAIKGGRSDRTPNKQTSVNLMESTMATAAKLESVLHHKKTKATGMMQSLQDENALLRAELARLSGVLKEQCPDFRMEKNVEALLRPKYNKTAGGGGSALQELAPTMAPPPPMHHAHSASVQLHHAAMPETKPEFNRSSSAYTISHTRDQDSDTLEHIRSPKDTTDEEILKRYVVLEFVDDSPLLRRQVCSMEEEFDEMRLTLKRIVKDSRSYCAASAGDLETGYQMAENLCQEDVFRLSPLMAKFGEGLKELTSIRETMLRSLESEFIVPVESFIKVDIKQALNMRRELERTRDVFETLESKYTHHRRTKERGVMGAGRPLQKSHDVVEDQLLGEYQTAKGKFEKARFGNIQKLNLLQAKKNFQVIQSAAHALTAFLDYFREGYQLLAGLAPELEMVKGQARLDQGNFDVLVEQWNQKRLQLESQLHRGAFPFMSKERRQQELAKRHEKVKVLSTQPKSIVPLHEGYLYKRSTGVRKDWKRRWFVLRGGKLFYYSSWKDLEPQPICDIVLCTVRPVKNSDLRCCFEIISPNKRSYMLQAVTDIEMHEWMESIRRAIEMQLTQQQQRPSLSRSSGSSDPDVKHLLEENPVCADCGIPGPNWVSINLGIVMCIACSGIHRSLGTHLSKIRSLTLDRLPKVQLQLLRRVGNGLANQVWEATLPPGVKPEGSHDTDMRAELERYIHDKYAQKQFVDKIQDDEDPASLFEKFFHAVDTDDIVQVIWCIAHGVSVDSCVEQAPRFASQQESSFPTGSTAMHVAASHGLLCMCEFLFQNGATLDLENGDNKRPIDMAIQGNYREVVEYLLQHLSTNLPSATSPEQAKGRSHHRRTSSEGSAFC